MTRRLSIFDSSQSIAAIISQVALLIAIAGILGSIYNLIKVSQGRAVAKESGESIYSLELSYIDHLWILMFSSFLAIVVLFNPAERPIDIHLPIGVNEVLLDSNNIYQQDEYFKVVPKDTVVVRGRRYVDGSKQAMSALQLAMSKNGDPSILKINDNYKTVEYIVDVETRGLLVDYKIKTYKLRFHNNSGPTTHLPDLENLPVVE